VLNGRHVSRLRGRGLNFEEMRDYLPGDDIRAIDWKATARSGSPHVRVFTEERDRPALLVVDQRMSMFFGTRLNMKSVCAAEGAAIVAFRILAQGDRVGGIVFDDEQILETPPRRSRKALHSFLSNISRLNTGLHAGRMVTPAAGHLNQVLKQTARLAHHDHMVVILSDFEGIDGDTRRHLAGIAEHNDLVLGVVHDPVAHSASLSEQVVLGDGLRQAEVDFSSGRVRDAVTEFSSGRLQRIFDWQREIKLSVVPLDCGRDTLEQIRGHLASLAPRRRVR
jgi:uncharacterized protein (DUF58 family)